MNRTAKVILDVQYRDGFGSAILRERACALYGPFCNAFRFTSAQIQAAEACRRDLDGTVSVLINTWLTNAATVRDLKVCLERWGHVELIRMFGLDKMSDSDSDVPEPFQLRALKETSSNPLALALEKKSIKQDVAAFIKQKQSHWLMHLCIVSNKTGAWEQLLAHLGLLTSPAVEKMVRDYKTEWQNTNRGSNPTLSVLEQLCENPEFGTQEIAAFARTLRALGVVELSTFVDEWTVSLAEKQSSETNKNHTLYSAAKEIADWLTCNNVAQGAQVTLDADKLTGKEIGAESLADVLVLTLDDFKAHFPLAKANKLAAAVAAEKKKFAASAQ